MKPCLRIAAVAVLLSGSAGMTHEPHVCPSDVPALPALAGHIEQHDIDGGAWDLDTLTSIGRDIFVAKFNRCDGQGRKLTTGTGDARADGQPNFSRISGVDSSACASCHNEPVAGGAGDFVANVFVLGQAADPILLSVDPAFSNERNTLGMHGSAAIEMLAREMTAELQAAAEVLGDGNHTITSKGVSFNITKFGGGVVAAEGIDPDLVVKPFHQAGVVTSIRQFTLNAMNHHHGMQAEERFDFSKGTSDFDGDGIERELTVGDITAVTLFQAALGNPGRLPPQNPRERAEMGRGERLFTRIGCAECHMPSMTLDSRIYSEPNPYNPSGTLNHFDKAFTFDMTREGGKPRLERAAGGGAIVRAYTDLKRHNLCDAQIRYFCNEKLAQGRPDLNGQPGEHTFLTRKLWDVGSSAPYGHRGDLPTIFEAIFHHGGEARKARDAFLSRPRTEQLTLIAFLKSLSVVDPDN